MHIHCLLLVEVGRSTVLLCTPQFARVGVNPAFTAIDRGHYMPRAVLWANRFILFILQGVRAANTLLYILYYIAEEAACIRDST